MPLHVLSAPVRSADFLPPEPILNAPPGHAWTDRHPESSLAGPDVIALATARMTRAEMNHATNLPVP